MKKPVFYPLTITILLLSASGRLVKAEEKTAAPSKSRTLQAILEKNKPWKENRGDLAIRSRSTGVGLKIECFVPGDFSIKPSPECYQANRTNSKKNLLIIGSSAQADLYYGMNEVLKENWNIYQVTGHGCAIAFSGRNKDYECAPLWRWVFPEIIEKYPWDLIVTGYQESEGDEWRTMISKILEMRKINVVRLGARVIAKPSLRELVVLEGSPEKMDQRWYDEWYSQEKPFSQLVQADVPGFFSYRDIFCPSRDHCIWELDNKLVYADSYHLSAEGSLFVAQKFKVWLEKQKFKWGNNNTSKAKSKQSKGGSKKPK